MFYEYDGNKRFYPLFVGLTHSNHSKDGVAIIESEKYLLVAVKESHLNINKQFIIVGCGYRNFNINHNSCYLITFIKKDTKKVKSGYIFYSNSAIGYGENWEQENYYWDEESIKVLLKKVKRHKLVFSNDTILI